MSTAGLSIILRILDNENRLVERADQKSISLLSILGVFMVFFIVYYRVIPMNPLTMALIVLYFIFALMSIISLIMAIRPRIRKEKGKNEDNKAAASLDPAFFSGISAFPDASAYKATLQKTLEDDASIADIYIRQIYSVARINSVKYKFVQRGVALVIITLAIELAIITYLFAYHLSSGFNIMPPIN
jgi:ABC-type bacteriocin/lantibiotic exporter with double-glycine peptidase domain